MWFLSFLLALFYLTIPSSALCDDKTIEIAWTPAEKAWLQTSPTLRFVYDPDWPPFEWRDEFGRYTGMLSDLYQVLEKETGIRFEPVPTKNWTESLALFKAKKVELLSAVTKTEEREAYMRFTRHTLFKLPTLLLQRFDRPELPKKLTLAVGHKSVGVVKGYAVAEYLRRTYPGIELVEFPTVRDGLDNLRSGTIDLFAINIATADYFIHRQGYGDLVKAAMLPYYIDLRIGLQPETPDIVVSILDKALASIPPSRYDTIYRRWTHAETEKTEETNALNLEELLPIDVVMIVLGILVLLALAGWYRFREKGALVLGTPLLVSALVIYGIALLVTAITLGNARSSRQHEIGMSLQTVLNVTHSSLREWFLSQRHHLNHIVNQTDLLAPLFHDENRTDTSKEKETLDIFLDLKRQTKEATGFLVIDRNGSIILASEPTLVHRTITFAPVRRQLERAFREGFAYVAPVKIPKDHLGHLRHYYIFNAVVDRKSHKPIAVFAMRLDPLPIFNIVRQGRIGKTGETYLINSQLQMISRSRFERHLKEMGLLPVNETSFLNIELVHEGRPTKAAAEALGRKKGEDVEGYPDYRGIPVLGAWVWDDLLDLAIIVEIDKSEAMASFVTLKTTIFAVVLSIVFLSLMLVLFIVWYAHATQRVIRGHEREIDRKNEELDTVSATIDQAVEERLTSLKNSLKRKD